MRHNPDYAVDGAGLTAMVRQLIREHPWCTLVSHVPGRSPAEGPSMVASHYPVMLEEDVFGERGGPEDEIVLLSHMGRPDEEKHQLGEHPMLAIIQGPHGYVSPGWYGYRPNVPTWNFAAAHLTGTPEILPDAENLAVLERLVEHFEQVLPDPHLLHATQENSDYAHRIVRGTVGMRLRITHIEAKEKMNQDKPASSVRSILEHLRGEGPYADPVLAERMERVNADMLAEPSAARTPIHREPTDV